MAQNPFLLQRLSRDHSPSRSRSRSRSPNSCRSSVSGCELVTRGQGTDCRSLTPRSCRAGTQSPKSHLVSSLTVLFVGCSISLGLNHEFYPLEASEPSFYEVATLVSHCAVNRAATNSSQDPPVLGCCQQPTNQLTGERSCEPKCEELGPNS